MFIKISSNHYLDAARVISILPAHSRPAIQLRDVAKKEGRLVNMKGGTVKIKSMCVLDTGQVALLSITPSVFIERVELREGFIKELNPRRGGNVFDESDVEINDLPLEKTSTVLFSDLGK